MRQKTRALIGLRNKAGSIGANMLFINTVNDSHIIGVGQNIFLGTSITMEGKAYFCKDLPNESSEENSKNKPLKPTK